MIAWIKHSLLTASLLFLSLCLCVQVAPAQQKEKTISIIRDAEIEQALRDYTAPIFKAAKLPSQSIKMTIVKDNSMNAFVSGGMHVFINTGLIMGSEDPLMLIGVLAHETGHITGGHLVRGVENFEKAGIQAAIGYILGAASIAAGAPAAGSALISGGTHAAQRTALKFSRLHEESADQAALEFLDKSGYSAKGLIELLETLQEKEKIYFADDRDPYSSSHPVSAERIIHINNHVKNSAIGAAPAPKALRDRQARIVAKLRGFILPPEDVDKYYPQEDVRPAALYARAIASHRKGKRKEAIAYIDALLEKEPKDPYYQELKGQILFEHGKVREAIPYYEAALAQLPGNALLELETGVAYLATEEEIAIPSALKYLEKVVIKEPRNVTAWHQLAIAYGRGGAVGMSFVALAEEAALRKNEEDVELYSKKARELLKDGSPALIRLNDIKLGLDPDERKKIGKQQEKE